MKAAVARKPLIRVAVVESDPLRFVGFRALFDTELDLELVSASLADLSQLQSIDLVLLGNRGGQNLYDIMASMKAVRPDLRIIVTGSGIDEETVLKAIAAGAKGYVDEAASPAEFIQALRIVNQGSVWAPRRVLSMFIERVSSAPGRIFPAGRVTFTDREKEVLEMLVAGRSNKEIGSALGIEERTVKAHVAKLMRKVGVQNRIALSITAPPVVFSVFPCAPCGYAFRPFALPKDSDPRNLVGFFCLSHTRLTYHRTWETGLETEIRVAAFSPAFFLPAREAGGSKPTLRIQGFPCASPVLLCAPCGSSFSL